MDEPGWDDLPEKEVGTSVKSRWVRELAVIAVITIVIAVVLRLFVVQTYFIPSLSMYPTLNEGNRIVVNKLSYDIHSVHRGDIVVFARPADENCGGPPVADLVKRVIGLPGETISLSRNGHVLIDGHYLTESWLPPTAQGVTQPGPAGTLYDLMQPYKIPAGHYFVMGDNRTDSCDSRWWGPIEGSLIVGKVDLTVWPLGSMRIF
jgi:signal peptidase I